MNNKFDIVKEMEHFWSSPMFTPLDNELVCQTCVKISQEKPDLSVAQLELVRSELTRHMYTRFWMKDPASAEEKARDWRKKFDEKNWELMQDKLRRFPGNYKYYLEYAVHSSVIYMFDYDAWTEDFASACLLAHGISHDFDGNMCTVDFDDKMMPFIKENSSLAFMRFRRKVAQPEAREVQKLGIFGGGLDPILYTDGFPLGQDGRQIVIYDQKDCRAKLEQLIGCTLEQANIDYRVESFVNAFSDPNQVETYDMILYDGVMSYYPEKKLDFLKGTNRLLKPGGMVFFDDQIVHPDLIFGLYVRGWTLALKPEPDLTSALNKNEELLPAAGFYYRRQLHQEVRGVPNVLVNFATKIP